MRSDERLIRWWGGYDFLPFLMITPFSYDCRLVKKNMDFCTNLSLVHCFIDHWRKLLFLWMFLSKLSKPQRHSVVSQNFQSLESKWKLQKRCNKIRISYYFYTVVLKTKQTWKGDIFTIGKTKSLILKIRKMWLFKKSALYADTLWLCDSDIGLKRRFVLSNMIVFVEYCTLSYFGYFIYFYISGTFYLLSLIFLWTQLKKVEETRCYY